MDEEALFCCPQCGAEDHVICRAQSWQRSSKPTQAARFRKELTAERGKTQHAADTKKQILSMKFL